MIRDFYRCFPLPWTLVSLGFLVILWSVPFIGSLQADDLSNLGMSMPLEMVLDLMLIAFNLFLFRNLIDHSTVLTTGERLSFYPFILFSSVCFLIQSGTLELLTIAVQLLFLIRTFKGLATLSMQKAAFDVGLIISLSMLIDPLYGLQSIMFFFIAYIYTQLNLRVVLLGLLGLAVPFLIYAQVAFLLDLPLTVNSLTVRPQLDIMDNGQGVVLLIYLVVLIGMILYNSYRSFHVMGTGPVRRRMLIRTGFALVAISMGIGFLFSLTGHGNTALLLMIPGLCILSMEFMRDVSRRYEPYLFLIWSLITLGFIWLA